MRLDDPQFGVAVQLQPLGRVGPKGVADGTMLRLIVLPPGAPPAAVNAMREALVRLNSDKAHAEDSLKAFGYVPVWRAVADNNAVAARSMTLFPRPGRSCRTTSRTRGSRSVRQPHATRAGSSLARVRAPCYRQSLAQLAREISQAHFRRAERTAS